MGRRFTRAQKQAVSIVSNRDASLDADHIKPFSKGGETDVTNAQLLRSTTNNQKGAFDFNPREWQQEFFDSWSQREQGRPFMLVAIPGGGKTFAALETMRRWMAAGSDRRGLVVVPTDNLREQWRDEAVKFGLNLQTKEFGTSFKDDYQGGVVTYSLINSSPLVFKKLLSVSPTMVVPDEIHHCGQKSNYGVSMQEACGGYSEMLPLSGTPWKTDGSAIPFVRYDANGYVVADYAYDYPKALQDEVVRYLTFQYDRGEIRYDMDGRVEAVDKEISDREAQQRLRKILSPDGEFVRAQVRSAHRKLIELRREIPDAAALAACIDQRHAHMVAETIKRETGCDPSVIVTDDALTNDSVKRFRDCQKEWLVTVRMVSEGTDIKRLQVLCYFSNITTDMFFRQLVGRVSRVRGMNDFEAYVYLPSDPRLIRCATNIENAQAIALRKKVERDVEIDRDMSPEDFESYSTSHSGVDFAMIGNRSLTIEEYKRAEMAAEAVGVSMEKVVRIWDLQKQPPRVDPPKPQAVQPKEERMDDLRRKCNKVAFRLSKLLDCNVKTIHGKFTPQRDMTESQLEGKLRNLTELCREALQ